MNEHTDKGLSGGRDSLVIIIGDRAEESFKRISADYKVRQVASPRVFTVEADQSELAKLRAVSGVTVVTSGDAPPGIMEKLDEGEALFVAAWLSRRKEGSSKQRLGEGLSWDAPGFTPPDAPTEDSEHNKQEKIKNKKGGQ